MTLERANFAKNGQKWSKMTKNRGNDDVIGRCSGIRWRRINQRPRIHRDMLAGVSFRTSVKNYGGVKPKNVKKTGSYHWSHTLFANYPGFLDLKLISDLENP